MSGIEIGYRNEMFNGFLLLSGEEFRCLISSPSTLAVSDAGALQANSRTHKAAAPKSSQDALRDLGLITSPNTMTVHPPAVKDRNNYRYT